MKLICGILPGRLRPALALILIMAVGASCRSDSSANRKDYLSIGDVIRHIELSGVKIEQVQPLQHELLTAGAAAAVMIDQQEIAIYKFDAQSEKAREILARLRKDEYIYVSAMKYPVVVKGAFVFLGVDNHPRKHKLMEAIRTLE